MKRMDTINVIPFIDIMLVLLAIVVARKLENIKLWQKILDTWE